MSYFPANVYGEFGGDAERFPYIKKTGDTASGLIIFDGGLQTNVGEAVFNGPIVADGQVTFNDTANFYVDCPSEFAEDVTITGGVFTSDVPTTFNNTVIYNNPITFNDTVDINGISTFNALMNIEGGVLQIDSTYTNVTASTGEVTQINGGQIQNTQGLNTTALTSTQLNINNGTSGFINGITINNSEISYENDSGNADQLIISSNTTDNPILIQSNCVTANGGGITLNTTQAGAGILLETTSNAFPLTPSNIQLITAPLNTQSSVILDTDLVYVRNGAMRIMNDRTNFLTGLTINEVSANNFQIINSAGSLTLGATINNIVLTSTQTQLAGVLTVSQTTYPPSITNALGYTIQKTFGPTNISDTTGTYNNIGSQALPAVAGVYNINCGFTYTASGADTLEEFSILLSLTSGTSAVEVNAFGGWRYFTEQNDNIGAAGLRYASVLCGTYINSTGSASTLYLNAYGKTTGSATILVQGNCSITKIA